jgi:hypothetical protein
VADLADIAAAILSNFTGTEKAYAPYARLHSAYDIIGLDMRGTGYSVPVQCDHNAYNALTAPRVFNESTFDTMVARSKAFGESCVNLTGPLIYHMGTDAAVQDLDHIRQSMGYKKLNYLGFSYGTRLGLQYAETFPNEVGRMILDGFWDRYLSPELTIITQAITADAFMNDFFSWCNTTSECALHGRDQAGIFNALLASAEAGTFHTDGLGPSTSFQYNGIVSPWTMVYASLEDMKDSTDVLGIHNWYAFAEFLTAGYDLGNGTGFSTPLAPKDTTASYINQQMSQFVIDCSDQPIKKLSAQDFRNIYTLSNTLAPITKGYGLSQLELSVCSGWPIAPSNPPHTLNPQIMAKLPPVMIVNAFYDELTMSMWALDIRSQMPTAFNVWRDGAGHTSYLQGGATSAAMNDFLIDGVVPEDGTVYQS